MMLENYAVPARLYVTFKVSADRVLLIRPNNTVAKEVIEGKREAIMVGSLGREHFDPDIAPGDVKMPGEPEYAARVGAAEFCRATLMPETLQNPRFAIEIVKIRIEKIE